jgi:hypothetical protein
LSSHSTAAYAASSETGGGDAPYGELATCVHECGEGGGGAGVWASYHDPCPPDAARRSSYIVTLCANEEAPYVAAPIAARGPYVAAPTAVGCPYVAAPIAAGGPYVAAPTAAGRTYDAAPVAAGCT